ncbi:SMEK domain-containing protein [Algoriphagus antarcticus]|uniref:SMEK domain-containing protein n=1 Tax=Algoriphagus antarcticus TaxID=238540 RepID=A0A3E0DKJ8_9BACT|nr:SMEK domain-containing protein [Algoriphagus antarcticus]REG82022.1 hypothetical protein C8N25_12311 [Algoriphagus antarcticus]
MNNREIKIKAISEYFARIEIQVRNLNHQNLNDLNVVSEVLFSNIFNVIFDYCLESTNKTASNHPCIDLIDKKNRVSIQVTSDKSNRKIQKTINCFSYNQMYQFYDRIIVFIIGEKQKSYRSLVLPKEFSFNPNEDIIDFKTLLRFTNNLTIDKMNKVINILQVELKGGSPKRNNIKNSRTKFKQIQTIKKRIEKHLVKNLTLAEWREYAELLEFEPCYRFMYSSLNIRSIEDRSYPELVENEKGYNNWMKLELWDFYPNGLEFVVQYSKKVVVKNGKDWRFALNNEEGALNCCLFLRLPYENIVELEMETDDYNSYPTIFVEYLNDDSPFEQEVYGLIGFYKREKMQKPRKTYYLGEVPSQK